MTSTPWNPLLDAPIFPGDGYARIADRIGRLLRTSNDILLIQAEAVVALEAVAASVTRPGLKSVNIVTSMYGGWFGGWMRRGGADVVDLHAEPGKPITAGAVETCLESNPEVRILSFVHAESASGIRNPLEEIVALARARGIVTVVDAVASVGGHALDVDKLGIDIAVIGPQKALSGPSGLSALSISEKAWKLVEAAGGPVASILSLLDQRDWIKAGRGQLPGTTAPLEFFALEQALARVEAEGVDNIVATHALAAKATRAGLEALGASLWVSLQDASHLVTTVSVSDPAQVLRASAPLGMELGAGVGIGAEGLIRLNHTGRRARFDVVLGNVVALGMALRSLDQPADVADAADAVAGIYQT